LHLVANNILKKSVVLCQKKDRKIPVTATFSISTGAPSPSIQPLIKGPWLALSIVRSRWQTIQDHETNNWENSNLVNLAGGTANAVANSIFVVEH
jgi:hypothetical protein